MHEMSHLEVDFGRPSGHSQGEGWCINASITFPKDEEVIFSEVGKLDKEFLQGVVVVISNLKGEEHVKCKDSV